MDYLKSPPPRECEPGTERGEEAFERLKKEVEWLRKKLAACAEALQKEREGRGGK